MSDIYHDVLPKDEPVGIDHPEDLYANTEYRLNESDRNHLELLSDSIFDIIYNRREVNEVANDEKAVESFLLACTSYNIKKFHGHLSQ